MNTNRSIFFLFLLALVCVEATMAKPYEMPRTQVVPIENSETDGLYELFIKLPEKYSENTDLKYPVIYTTDAVWHFEMLSGATEYLMPDVILVGISWQKDLDPERADASRFRDYSVIGYSDPEIQARFQGGQANKHLSFIRNDVISYIEKNYRAAAGERTYFGYSLSGQFGAYALLAQPDSFRYYILGSPAFSPRSAEYIDKLETASATQQQKMTASVFVSIGELDQREMAGTENLVSVLQRRRQSGLTLSELEVIESSDHGTAFPETVIRGIKWLQRQKQ